MFFPTNQDKLMATLGCNGLNNMNFSIFETATSQGMPSYLPWEQFMSLAKTPDENVGPKSLV